MNLRLDIQYFVVGPKDCMAIENNATEKNESLVSNARLSESGYRYTKPAKVRKR